MLKERQDCDSEERIIGSSPEKNYGYFFIILLHYNLLFRSNSDFSQVVVKFRNWNCYFNDHDFEIFDDIKLEDVMYYFQ